MRSFLFFSLLFERQSDGTLHQLPHAQGPARKGRGQTEVSCGAPGVHLTDQAGAPL